ncbi:MAG: redoxin domain-containing protein [Clostridiales bacterium]|nr:redoxin domain-containing protein [Clostridiales bacterium]
MITAIIVISIVLAVGLLIFFVGRAVRKANLPQKAENPNAPAKEKGFKGFILGLKNFVPTKRRLIQVYAALLYNANIKGFVSGNIYTGENTKYMCVPGLNCYSCPGAVGACPMGALQNSLAASNTRAPYYVLGILALFGLMLARTICGFLCPVGLCQELLYKIRTPKLKKSRATRILSYFKYVILALAIAIPLIYAASNIPLPAFCKYICPEGTLGGAVMLLINPDNADMFGMLGWQFTWKFSLAIAFVVASVFIFRVFCRFFCPLGAIYGFFNKFALLGVTVNKENCTDCGLCVAHCKMDVKHVGDHECINCGECMAVCPTKAISWKGSTIFLRHAAVSEPIPQEKPLTLTEGEVKIAATVATAAEHPIAAQEIAAADTIADVTATEQTLDPAIAATATEAKPSKTKKPLKFWLEVAAWTVALVVLLTALIYYNFIYKDEEYVPPQNPDGPTDIVTGYNVGDIAPDFTLNMYNDGGTYNLYSNRGSIAVVNFWATWCTPCVEEIPYFNELAKNHSEISVVAIHGSSADDVQAYINNNWGGYTLQFAQDILNGQKCQTYLALGGKNMWPMTLIIDAEGKILYNSTQSFKSYEQLETLVTSFMTESGEQ